MKKFVVVKLLLGTSIYFELYFSCQLFIPQSLTWWIFLSGTSVIQVTATDADDPTYGNSARVVYSILQGQPYFSVDSRTGMLFHQGMRQCENKRKSFKQKVKAVHCNCGQRNTFLWLRVKIEQYCVRAKARLCLWAPEWCAFYSDIFTWMTVFCSSGAGWVGCCECSCWHLSLQQCLWQI